MNHEEDFYPRMLKLLNDIDRILDILESELAPELQQLTHSSQATLLHYAAEHGYEDLVKDLIDLGSPINTQDKFGRTPLILALKGGHKVVVKLLLKANADIHISDCQGKSALRMILELKPMCLGMISALFDQLTVDEIIQSIDLEESTGKLPEAGYMLKDILLSGELEVVHVLLSYENVNDYRDGISGGTLLHTAVHSRKKKMIEALIEFGADVKIMDRYGSTPLDYLYGLGIEPSDDSAEILKVLLSQPTALPWTYVIKVLSFGDRKAIRTLIEANVDFSTTDLCSNTVLHFLAQSNNARALKLLSNLYLDLNAVTDEGYTPLDVAAMNNSVEAMKYLLEHGAKINHDCGPIVGTLHLMFQQLHMPDEQCIILLLKHGADPQTYVSANNKFLTIFDTTIWLSQHLENVDQLNRVRPVLAQLAIAQEVGKTIAALTRFKIKLQLSWRQYFDMCVRQVKRLSEISFYGNIRLLDFLVETDRKIIGYIRNQELVHELERAIGEFEEDSPYPDLLRCRLKEAIELAKLRENAVATICWIVGWKNVSHYFILAEYIFEYLSRQDMETLNCF